MNRHDWLRLISAEAGGRGMHQLQVAGVSWDSGGDPCLSFVRDRADCSDGGEGESCIGSDRPSHYRALSQRIGDVLSFIAPNAGIYHVDAVMGDPVAVYFGVIDRPRARTSSR